MNCLLVCVCNQKSGLVARGFDFFGKRLRELVISVREWSEKFFHRGKSDSIV